MPAELERRAAALLASAAKARAESLDLYGAAGRNPAIAGALIKAARSRKADAKLYLRLAAQTAILR